MMSFMRLIATKVLLVLLASWVLALLQPCCEVIASTLPHEHGLSKEAHHSSQEHSTTQSGAVSNHQHCETADTDIDEIPVLVSEKLRINNSKPKSDDVVVRDIFPGERSVSPARHVPIFNYSPTGPPNRVYLQTQRLRI